MDTREELEKYRNHKYDREEIQYKINENLEFYADLEIRYDSSKYDGWNHGGDIVEVYFEGECGFYDVDGNLVDDDFEKIKKEVADYYGIPVSQL